MKSERRHELQHNELADWLEKQITAIKPYTNAILGAVILVLALTAFFTWRARTAAEDANKAWDRMATATQAGSASDMGDIAKEHEGTMAGEWASLRAGDLHLAAACDVLLQNRDNASQELSDAVEAYKKVVGSSTPMFRQWAKYGLARALDTQCTFDPQCNTDKAIEAYEAVVTESPDGAYAAAAQRRLDDLKNPSTLALYRKINKHEAAPLGSGLTNPFPESLNFDSNLLQEGPVDTQPGFKPVSDFDDSTSDATTEDNTSTTEETGTPDAGTPDAGTPDAGTPDAGTPSADAPPAGDATEESDQPK